MTHHLEEHTYIYGGKEHVDEEHEHKQLYMVLLKKIAYEFMGLGLLALLVFICERYGVFKQLTQIDWCSDDSKDCPHLPKTALDWFHMAEIVHFSLFGGMCLYFVMMGFFVAGSIRDIRIWEEIRTEELNELEHKKTEQQKSYSPSAWGNMPDKIEYVMMRDRFITGVMTWEGDEIEADRFGKLLSLLFIDTHAMSAKSVPLLVDERLRSQAFDFSAFLALNVEHSVEDAVEVHISSWAVVWIVLAASFPVHYYLHATFSTLILSVVFVPLVVWLILCLVVYRRMQKSLIHRSEVMDCDIRFHDGFNTDTSDSKLEMDDAEEGHSNAHNYKDVEREEEARMSCLDRWFFSGHHLMRFAQVAGFAVSYVISREVFEPPEWTEAPEVAALTTAMLCVLYIILVVWFYWHAPIFLALMSLPPRFNKYDEKNMWDLLLHGAKQNVVETYLNDHSSTEHVKESKRSDQDSAEIVLELNAAQEFLVDCEEQRNDKTEVEKPPSKTRLSRGAKCRKFGAKKKKVSGLSDQDSVKCEEQCNDKTGVVGRVREAKLLDTIVPSTIGQEMTSDPMGERI